MISADNRVLVVNGYEGIGIPLKGQHMESPSTLRALMEEVVKFRDARDWKQFHNAKDLAIALSIESAELLELFLWQDADAVDHVTKSNTGRQRLSEELADILIFVLYLSHESGIDLVQAVEQKLKINDAKYPVAKSYGVSKKYTELE